MTLQQKYKPESLKNLILPNNIKKVFEKPITENFYFHSPPGTGKSSLARILSKSYDSLFVNASYNSSVDHLKDKIYSFCTSSNLTNPDKFKLVVLDEFSGVSIQYVKAFRSMMDEVSKTTKFILTANNDRADTEDYRAVISRCTSLNFLFPDHTKEMKQSVFSKLKMICENEEIEFDERGLATLAKMYYPDLRQVFSNLFYLINQGESVTEKNVNTQTIKETELFSLIFNYKDDPVSVHNVLYDEYKNRVSESFQSLHIDLVKFIVKNKPELIKYIPQISIKVTHYDSIKHSLIQPIFALLSCVHELQILIK